MAIHVQMLSFQDKTQKPRAILAPTIFSLAWNSMIKTLLIVRMDISLRCFSRIAILVQMLSFRGKTQKPRAISYLLNSSQNFVNTVTSKAVAMDRKQKYKT